MNHMADCLCFRCAGPIHSHLPFLTYCIDLIFVQYIPLQATADESITFMQVELSDPIYPSFVIHLFFFSRACIPKNPSSLLCVPSNGIWKIAKSYRAKGTIKTSQSSPLSTMRYRIICQAAQSPSTRLLQSSDLRRYRSIVVATRSSG